MTTLPPEAFACRPLERAELPRTVWHIAVAALIGNAWGPVYDAATQFVVSGSRWSGPMGRPVTIPPRLCWWCRESVDPGGEENCRVCYRMACQRLEAGTVQLARLEIRRCC